VSKTFRPYEPDQISLMPASMRDRLPSDHLAHFISDVVDNLDLSVIMERYAGEERWYPAMPSRLILTLKGFKPGYPIIKMITLFTYNR
jgi:transposase